MSIFVSIASYRDPLCPTTLESLFKHAQYPERVFVGLVQQNEPKDPVCEIQSRYSTQIRTVRMKAHEAKGPADTRYHCSQLMKHEDFFFQIDSHSLLVHHWDTKLIDMYTQLQQHTFHKKVVLSHYPRIYEDYQVSPSDGEDITMITHGYLNAKRIPVFHGAEYKRPPQKPILSWAMSANFLFVSKTFLDEIPFDPHLPYLFMGEEILLSVRAYTHGWDVYTPHRNILYHLYTRKKDPKFWTSKTYQSPILAERKVRMMIGMDPIEHNGWATGTDDLQRSMYTHGIGSVRPLWTFYQHFSFGKSLRIYDPLTHSSTWIVPPRKKTMVESFGNVDQGTPSSSSSIYGWWWLLCLLVVILLGICLLVYGFWSTSPSS